MVVLKADKRCHDIRCYRSRFLQTLIVIFPRKSTQVKIHTKMAIFWLVFSAKNPVKSDKLALIEGKILNLMFLDIFRCYPLRFGYEQLTIRDKKLRKSLQSYYSAIFKRPNRGSNAALACLIPGCHLEFYAMNIFYCLFVFLFIYLIFY